MLPASPSVQRAIESRATFPRKHTVLLVPDVRDEERGLASLPAALDGPRAEILGVARSGGVDPAHGALVTEQDLVRPNLCVR